MTTKIVLLSWVVLKVWSDKIQAVLQKFPHYLRSHPVWEFCQANRENTSFEVVTRRITRNIDNENQRSVRVWHPSTKGVLLSGSMLLKEVETKTRCHTTSTFCSLVFRLLIRNFENDQMCVSEGNWECGPLTWILGFAFPYLARPGRVKTLTHVLQALQSLATPVLIGCY